MSCGGFLTRSKAVDIEPAAPLRIAKGNNNDKNQHTANNANSSVQQQSAIATATTATAQKGNIAPTPTSKRSSVASATASVTPSGATAAAATAPPVLSAHEQFMTLLHHTQGRQLFLDQLRRNHSEHHLLYWETTLNYKIQGRQSLIDEGIVDDGLAAPIHSLTPLPPQQFTHPLDVSTNAMLQQTALKIYNDYIKNGVKLQININDHCRTAIKDNLAHATIHLFDDADNVAIELIKGNYFFAFKESEHWPEYLALKARDDQQRAREQEKRKSKTACVIS